MALADSLKSLREVNLSDLTLDNLGSWPMAVKVVVWVLVFGLVCFLGWNYHLKGLREQRLAVAREPWLAILVHRGPEHERAREHGEHADVREHPSDPLLVDAVAVEEEQGEDRRHPLEGAHAHGVHPDQARGRVTRV